MLTEQEKKVSEAMELLPTLWIKKYAIKNESGIPIEFKDHYFMRDLYNDMSPLQVWLKPPQIGATVAEILKSFYCANKKKWDIIYTLPTNSDVNDMAGGKINRLVAQNPILSKWVKDHDTVEQKSIGKNIIYYRGTFSQKQAMMVSSDLNIHDEVDASDPEVIVQYETRLQAKADGKRWYFSHPSIAGFGVDIYWQQSDKKEWFITCPSCRREQQLKWPENVDLTKKIYICSLCRVELTDDSRRYGIWKATSDGPFSGYHISQLMCAWISAEKIVNDFYDTNKGEQYFYNKVLGLPYTESESKISSEVVLRNCDGQTNAQDGRIIIGVDTGLPIHYTIMNKQGVFFYGKCKSPTATYDPYDDLEKLLIRFPRSILVSDQGGDLIGIRRLQAKYLGRVFLCYYRKDRKTQELIRWGDKDEFGIVVVDRNRMMQLMIDQFRDTGRITLNGTKEDFKEYASHFNSLYKVVEETPYGAEFKWERNGADHFCHAQLYALVGFDKFAQDLSQIIKKDTFMANVPVGTDSLGMVPVNRLRKRKTLDTIDI